MPNWGQGVWQFQAEVSGSVSTFGVGAMPSGPFRERGSALPSGLGGSFAADIAQDPLQLFHGERGIRIFREMRYNDAIVGALLMATRMIMKQITWLPSLAEDAEENDQEAIDARDHLKQCMDDMTMTWPDVISDSLEAITYGWEAMETTYKIRQGEEPDPATGSSWISKHDDRRIGWAKIAHRDQLGLQRWILSPHGDLLGMVHRVDANQDEVPIPIAKMVLFRTEHTGGNPEGFSWLRTAYRAYRFKKQLEWIEAIGAERGLVGLPVLHMPMGANVSANSQDLSRAYDLVEKVRADAFMGVVLPPGTGKEEAQQWKLELMSAPGSRDGSAIDTMIRRWSQEIVTSILAHFILLGMNQTGTYALSKDQRDLWHLAMNGLKATWQDIINRKLVEPLFRMNQGVFPNREKWPQIVASDVAQHELDKVINAVTQLSGINLLNVGEDDRNRLRDLIGWPNETQEQVTEMEAQKAEQEERRKLSMEALKNPAPVVAPPPGAPPGRRNGGPPPPKDARVAAAEEYVGKPIPDWEDEDWFAWTEAGDKIGAF